LRGPYTVVCGLSQFDQKLRSQLGEQIRAQRFAAIFERDTSNRRTNNQRMRQPFWPCLLSIADLNSPL
jgi:hypothetical protein